MSNERRQEDPNALDSDRDTATSNAHHQWHEMRAVVPTVTTNGNRNRSQYMELDGTAGRHQASASLHTQNHRHDPNTPALVGDNYRENNDYNTTRHDNNSHYLHANEEGVPIIPSSSTTIPQREGGNYQQPTQLNATVAAGGGAAAASLHAPPTPLGMDDVCKPEAAAAGSDEKSSAPLPPPQPPRWDGTYAIPLHYTMMRPTEVVPLDTFAQQNPVLGFIVATPLNVTAQEAAMVKSNAQFPPPLMRAINASAQPNAIGAIAAPMGCPQLVPYLGIPVEAVCCHCDCKEYSGRLFAGRSKLSIVPPTAAMSGADHLPAPPTDMEAELFRPCLCPEYYHRGCFRDKRAGLTYFNNASYYECPDCLFTYRMERVMGGGMSAADRGAAVDPNRVQTSSTSVINTDELSGFNLHFTIARRIFFLWACALLLFAIAVLTIAGIAYFADDKRKNVPVFICMMITSAVFEYPSDESIEKWRAEFALPETAVWPYYGGMGVFVVCVTLLLGAMVYHCCFSSASDGSGDIQPSIRSYFGCSSFEYAGAIGHRNEVQRRRRERLDPKVQSLALKREGERQAELRDTYSKRTSWSHMFSLGTSTSFGCHDCRYNRPTYTVGSGGRRTYQRYNPNPSHGYYAHAQHDYYSHHYTYYDHPLCCLDAVCCPTGRHNHARGCTCDCSDSLCCACCDCGGGAGCGCCDDRECRALTFDEQLCCCCCCDGGGSGRGGGGCPRECGCGGADAPPALLTIALVVLLIVVIIIVLGVLITAVLLLIAKSCRVAAEISQLAYIQALEEEEHVFVLGINETWRPLDQV